MEDKRQFVYSSRNGIGKEAITHYNVINNNNNYTLGNSDLVEIC